MLVNNCGEVYPLTHPRRIKTLWPLHVVKHCQRLTGIRDATENSLLIKVVALSQSRQSSDELYCIHCQRFVETLFDRSAFAVSYPQYGGSKVSKDFDHLPDARRLLSSSQFCEFCALIRDAGLREYPDFIERGIHQPLIRKMSSAYRWPIDSEPASPTMSRIFIDLPQLNTR